MVIVEKEIVIKPTDANLCSGPLVIILLGEVSSRSSPLLLVIVIAVQRIFIGRIV